MKTMFLKNYWHRLRCFLLTEGVEVAKPIYAFFFQRNKKPWKQNLQRLRHFPDGSLGRELARFLDQHQLKWVPLYESHDVYHLLLDFKPELEDEVAMQFFLIGNGKWSLFVTLTAALGAVLMPDSWAAFKQAFRRGRSSACIRDWKFEHMLYEPLESLKQLINRQPVTRKAYFF
jgi:ubiquinone biosynthesis protein Coq4